ncbi:hypothetical protein AMTR_s00042p00026240 [Amborella trichopoda]|uniref:Uncharacterized protein n=1 Tax=Amborella trichopoda TaxID=13333 RepID=W1P140_AMBTC|nr:hypothetical protein AMTR_s00042p00026240 [Amborella trichopoda]
MGGVGGCSLSQIVLGRALLVGVTLAHIMIGSSIVSVVSSTTPRDSGPPISRCKRGGTQKGWGGPSAGYGVRMRRGHGSRSVDTIVIPFNVEPKFRGNGLRVKDLDQQLNGIQGKELARTPMD